MIYEDALSAARRHVAEAFKAGTSTFPHYTLHGADHLEELDRLALLIAEAIPALDRDRLNLLRLAIILHDFAMVDVPDPDREAELRKQMGSDLGFSDIVRKTHQDEIERSFTRPDRITFLQGLVPTASAQVLEDATTIAKHHRFHPLHKAPAHLADLCALVRILDELDIGPKRAPLPTYVALRARMDVTSRFHWLKHICTRAIDRYGTLFVEERFQRRVLKVSVAVKATKSTWKPIQEMILTRLRDCLEKEGVNEVLRSTLNTEFELAPAPEPTLSGTSLFLAPIVKKDLENLPDSVFHPKLTESFAPPHSTKKSGKSLLAVSLRDAEKPAREFKIVCLPPELLAENLCISGRLTIIGNRYVQPGEETVAGIPKAPNRIYIGAADSGKTRAALEWIHRLTAGVANQWVVLRTSMGTLPEYAENIVLDTSHYQNWHYLLPQKAILFLDDLPAILPQPTDSVSSTIAVQTIFRWYQDQSYFRERRLIGTLRMEDIHTQPEWPSVLPHLGQPLELIRTQALGIADYQSLWEGMATGATSRSVSDGIISFRLNFDDDFINKIKNQRADPEAVAAFIQFNVLKGQTIFTTEDASRFLTSATLTWIQETWPAMLTGYDSVAVRVFFTLARLFDAGLRSRSKFRAWLGGRWEFHAAFGPEICALRGGVAENYLPVLRLLLEDGHACGEAKTWIRPRFDFLLQADHLEETEILLPPISWFADRSLRLEPYARLRLAYFFASDLQADNFPVFDDPAWLAGYGWALSHGSRLESSQDRKQELARQAESILEHCLEIYPQSFTALTELSALRREALSSELNESERSRLKKESISLARNAVEIYPSESKAWYILGRALSNSVEEETSNMVRRELLDESIRIYRKSAEIAQGHDVLVSLANNLRIRALEEQNANRRQELRDESVTILRGLISDNQNSHWGWLNLSASLIHKASEPLSPSSLGLLEEAIYACHRAIELNPDNLTTYRNLALASLAKARLEPPEEARNSFDEAIASSERVARLSQTQADDWSFLASALEERAELEDTEAKTLELRQHAAVAYNRLSEITPMDASVWERMAANLGLIKTQQSSLVGRIAVGEEEISAVRQYVGLAQQNAEPWSLLAAVLVEVSRDRGDILLLEEALRAARQAASLGGSRYNLACALVLTSNYEQALTELQACLQRGEISRSEVLNDSDWEALAGDLRFQQLIAQDRPLPTAAPTPPDPAGT